MSLRALGVVALAIVACAAPQPTASTPTAGATAPPSATAETATAAPATSSCRAPAAPTLEQTEGPFFKSGSPERTSLFQAGLAGTRIVLTGVVVTRSCKPVANAKLDFWQANANGEYDNAGFTLRGHQLADAQGRYRLDTIMPGEYTGRTPHIHVKVAPPGGASLTSQLYFPDQRSNASDSIFRPELLVRIDQSERTTARFDFVLDLP